MTRRHLAARRRAWPVVALATGLLLSTAGCSDGEKDDPAPPSTSSSPSASASASSDPQAEAKKDIVTAYRKSWQAQVAAYAKASAKGTDLQKYTSLHALATIEQDLTNLRAADQVITGKPGLSPEVTAVDLDKKIPEAKVTDCVDISDWRLVEEKSKKPVPLPSQRLIRYVSVAKLEKWGSGWVVTELKSHDRSC